MTEKKTFELILFDLEGTLVDFQWRLAKAVKELLPVLSHAGIDTALYGTSPSYASLYNTTRDITAAWDPKDSSRLFEQLAIIYDTYDRDALSRWMPYPETQQVLERLSAHGYRMGVVSNCGSHAANTVIKRFSWVEFFEITLARNDVLYLKPSPEGLNLALEKLCVPPEKTLFVGDSLNDILAANQVPMLSCFLSGGESIVTGEDGRMATFQIFSFSGLADILLQ